MATQPTFLSKPIEQMSHEEWESICDGCGLCCQVRMEDEATGEITLTNAACRMLNLETLQCSDYPNRQKHVKDCVKISPENVHQLTWLPYSCSYRVVARGEPLADWHYLLCGNKQKVHTHGPSMLGELVCEDEVDWD